MGISFSVQSKDKRRRSNRLSKPPQNQASSNWSNSRPPVELAEQPLSLPSTPTAWQNPWAGGCIIPADSRSTVSPGVRSQSLSTGPFRCEATWATNISRLPERNAQSTADPWLPSPTSPTSPTPASSRRGFLYRWDSFNPSNPVTFQPTTLQSNPQSPLIGQPRRSYSVHSPGQGPGNNIQHRTLDRFDSLNSHSRVSDEDCPPIRRRSLLMRPGVATRKATKHLTSFITEPCQPSIDSPDLRCASPPPPPQEDAVSSDFESTLRLRPPTPNDFGYTHLGALKLGSLRVVNGSTSPSSSYRTRLDTVNSPVPEANYDSVESTGLQVSTETGDFLSLASLPDGFELYANYCRAMDDSTPDHVMGGSPIEAALPTCNVPHHHTNLAKGDTPTTILSIPPASAAREDVDLPNSPFSFEKSPTYTTDARANLHEAEDEGISIHDHERMLVSQPEKIPERNLSYSSYASSYRKGDSGYSSATSHRTSIDSHTSLRRSTRSRGVTLGGNSWDTEVHDTGAILNFGNQSSENEHLSHQGQKVYSQPVLGDRPSSMPEVHRGRPTKHSKKWPRRSSLVVSEASSRALSLPLYCAQLRNLECATPIHPSSGVPQMFTTENGSVNGCSPRSSQTHAVYPPSPEYIVPQPAYAHRGHDVGGCLKAYYVEKFTNLPSWNSFLYEQPHSSSKPHRATSADRCSQRFSMPVGGGQYWRHSNGVQSDIWLPMPDQEFLSLSAEPSNPNRSLIHRRAPFKQQSLEFTGIYA
ncbi:hypothetical protein BJX99DRAFT_42338 [Aspergillus californicus]